MPGSLNGIIVADFSRVLAGPYASMLLADHGATVIKVEKPSTGDDTRSWGPPFTSDGKSTYFESVNRNKKSIALDLNDQRDLIRAHNLARQADVLIENFKVDTLAKYNLDYATLVKFNPRVIYCSISGFGTQSGKNMPGYDLLVQAMGGLMSITGDHTPTKAGVAVVDVLTGLHAAIGILTALYSRDHSGSGQKIEVNLLSSLLSSMVNQSAAFAMTGVSPVMMGNAHPSVAPYESFTALDQKLIIAVGNDQQFTNLCHVLEIPELPDATQFSSNPNRVANRTILVEILNEKLIKRPAHEWHTLLTEAGVPCGPINSIAQGFELAENLGLDPLRGNGQVANPIDMSRTPIVNYQDPPNLGADTDEIVRALNLDSPLKNGAV